MTNDEGMMNAHEAMERRKLGDEEEAADAYVSGFVLMALRFQDQGATSRDGSAASGAPGAGMDDGPCLHDGLQRHDGPSVLGVPVAMTACQHKTWITVAEALRHADKGARRAQVVALAERCARSQRKAKARADATVAGQWRLQAETLGLSDGDLRRILLRLRQWRRARMARDAGE